MLRTDGTLGSVSDVACAFGGSVSVCVFADSVRTSLTACDHADCVVMLYNIPMACLSSGTSEALASVGATLAQHLIGRGFGASCNAGAGPARRIDFIILPNPDAVVTATAACLGYRS